MEQRCRCQPMREKDGRGRRSAKAAKKASHHVLPISKSNILRFFRSCSADRRRCGRNCASATLFAAGPFAPFLPPPPSTNMHPTPVLAATPAAEPSQPPRNDAPREQYMLVLSGLIGSGKSTFARALVEHFGDWRRCNQDELGDRHAVVYAARTALLAGHHVVIDRTNIDAKQRRTWLELARELNASTADGERTRSVVTISLTLTISIDEAERRLKLRVGHETIQTPEQALGILPHFLRTYQKASSEEGFHYVLTWPATRMSQNPTRDEVNAMLFDRLSAEERGEGVLPERPPPRAGGRGRGRGRGRGEARPTRGASALHTPHLAQHSLLEQVQQPGLDDSHTPPSFAAAAAAPSVSSTSVPSRPPL